MNEDDSDIGQQGYGSNQDITKPQSQQGQQGDQDTDATIGSEGATGDPDDVSTGQASYGNSGEADLLSQGQQGQGQSQNSPSLGHDSDMGQTGSETSIDSDQPGSGFIGSASSGDNMGSSGDPETPAGANSGMPLGTVGGGYGGSDNTSRELGGQSANQPTDATGQSASDDLDRGVQSYATLDDDDDDTSGITDIETERSQCRETDIEGSAL